MNQFARLTSLHGGRVGHIFMPELFWAADKPCGLENDEQTTFTIMSYECLADPMKTLIFFILAFHSTGPHLLTEEGKR